MVSGEGTGGRGQGPRGGIRPERARAAEVAPAKERRRNINQIGREKWRKEKKGTGLAGEEVGDAMQEAAWSGEAKESRRNLGRLVSFWNERMQGLQEREALAREELEARRRLDSEDTGLFRHGLLWEREREGTERCEAREEEGRNRKGRVTGAAWSTGRRRRGREVEERSGAAACDEVEEEAGRGGGWVGLVAGSGGSRGCLERWLGEKGIWEDPEEDETGGVAAVARRMGQLSLNLGLVWFI